MLTVTTTEAAATRGIPRHGPKSEPKLEVAKWASGSVVIFLGREEVDHLGGIGSLVRCEVVDGAWVLVPNLLGLTSNSNRQRGLRSVTKIRMYHGQALVGTSMLNRIVPTTARTALPSEYRESGGFTLFPDLVESTPSQRMPSAEPQPRQRKRTILLSQTASDLIAKVATQPESSAAWIPMQSGPMAVPKSASIDDLKTALEMLRTAARDLGAELYIDEVGLLRARIVL